MKIRFAVPITLASALAFLAAVSLAPAASAQRPGEHHDNVHANGGHIPEGPARREARAKPEIDRRPGGRVNSVPHVHDNHWYGRDRPSDKRYVLPGGFSFEIASWDWDLAASWCWDCAGDNFVVYDDPDHPGWYLVYNAQTGVYVHAQYMGS